MAVGSFINAAVWRIKQQTEKKKSKSSLRSTDYSLLKGRSVCPKCGHQLAVKDLVPVISWLWLRGKCRYCGQPISIQYPIVELTTAGLFAWSYLALDPANMRQYVDFGFWLAILTGLVVLAVYDWLHKELPNKVMWILIGLTFAQLLVLAVWTQSPQMLGLNLMAGLLVGLFFYALFAFSKGRWMGGGDVKLAFLMGLLLGGRNVLVALFVGFNSAALFSVFSMAAKKLSRKDTIPFGPFLIAGTIIARLYGNQLINAYINLFTP